MNRVFLQLQRLGRLRVRPVGNRWAGRCSFRCDHGSWQWAESTGLDSLILLRKDSQCPLIMGGGGRKRLKTIKATSLVLQVQCCVQGPGGLAVGFNRDGPYF